MSENSRVPNPELVRGLTARAGCPWPPPLYVVSTGSTNADAARLVGEAAVDGTCVVAGEQTAGRGRNGRSWVSEPGVGLWTSTILRGCAHPTHLPLLGALAVVDAARTVADLTWGIKWPNDVLDTAGRKVAGILVEVVDEAAVVGIGINIEQAPSTVANAGSWVAETGVSPDRTLLLAELMIALHARVGQSWLASLADYRRLCRTLGRRVHVALPGGEQLDGVALDVDDHGHLRVQVGQTVRTVVAGDVLHATIAS